MHEGCSEGFCVPPEPEAEPWLGGTQEAAVFGGCSPSREGPELMQTGAGPWTKPLKLSLAGRRRWSVSVSDFA